MVWVIPRDVGYFGGSLSWVTYQTYENQAFAIKQVKWIDVYSLWMSYNFRLVLKTENVIIAETNKPDEIVGNWKQTLALWDHCKENKTVFLEIIKERAINSVPELHSWGKFIPSNSAVPLVPPNQTSIKVSHCQLLYFATNRKESTSSFFEGPLDARAHYGICQVTVPEMHTIGADKFGTLSPYRWLSDELGSTNSSPVLNFGQEWDSTSFWVHLEKSMETANDGLIFIHGFNNSFQDAAVRAAQISCDIKFAGVTGFFAWPSAASVAEYSRDEITISSSEVALFEFVQMFAKKVKKLHLIAHSMGNRGLVSVLQKCKEAKINLGHVVLAAPDVDTSDFEKIYPDCCVTVEGIKTLYVSRKDRALELSAEIHNDYRLGLLSPDLYFQGLDTVDVSQVDTSYLGHGYVASCQPVLYDLHLILLDNKTALERNDLLSNNHQFVLKCPPSQTPLKF